MLTNFYESRRVVSAFIFFVLLLGFNLFPVKGYPLHTKITKLENNYSFDLGINPEETSLNVDHIFTEKENEHGIISTGPFDCTASWIFGPPQVETCKEGEADLQFSIKIYKKEAVLDPFGIPTGDYEYLLGDFSMQYAEQGWEVTDMPIGKYKVVYDVSTPCQKGKAYAEFEVKDLTAPVAICDDELNISVGGQGIARVTVADVDEGSWDNCQLESLDLRRNLDDCLDAYLTEVLGVSSLDDLEEEEFTNSHGDKGKRWYRYMDTQKMILISYEPGKDGSNHYYTWWANEVYFTCCDIATDLSDFVVLELRAIDKAHNKNICWMDVMVESKQVATCWAPADIAIACTDLNFDPADYDQVVAALGAAADLVTVDFNCAAVLSDTISWAPADCSEGVLTRTYTVTTTTSKGVVERSCTQKIEIYNVNDYLIKFPADAEDTCDGDGGDDLELTTYACDIFAVHRDTAVFEASGDACFKRYVTYRVINWCEYDGVSLEPTIVPRDVDCDGKLDECTWVRVEGAPKWNSDKPTNTVWIDDDADPKDKPVITFPRTADSYTPCDDKEYWITPGYWEYTQVIKVYDDEAPELTVTTEDLDFCPEGSIRGAEPEFACNAEVMILFEVEDLCTGRNVEVRSVLLAVNGVNPTDYTGTLYNVDGENGSYMISSIAGEGLPVGNHIFYVRVADDCGNITNRLIEFSVADCKTPAPICIAMISTDLVPVTEGGELVGGANLIWATDFIASGVEDCTPHPNADVIAGSDNDVRYYVVRQDSLEAVGLDEPTKDFLTEEHRSVAFDCDDNGKQVKIFVIAEDGNGNFDFCMTMVEVIRGKDPDPCVEVNCEIEAPVCLPLVVVDLGPIIEDGEVVGGALEMWSNDYHAQTQYDCNPHPNPDLDGDVRYYAVRQDSLFEAGLTEPDERYVNKFVYEEERVNAQGDTITVEVFDDYRGDDMPFIREAYRGIWFTCDDAGKDIPVYIIAVNGLGQFAYCISATRVQAGSTFNPCVPDTTSRVAVSGLISTERGEVVTDVEVALSGLLYHTQTTDQSGRYIFGNLIQGYDYSVAPVLDNYHQNGVSTYDLVLISKHILGIESLNSPYKLLAADVNNSQSITTLDLIQIRKLILNIEMEFANTTSWVFVDKNYAFPDPSNPWAEQTPSIINLNNLEDDMMTGDFVAIKRGDVNGSAIANSRMAAPRNIAGTFNVRTQDVAMKAGNEYTLSFTAEELAQIQGYQFTLNFDNSVLELVDINYGVASEENFGLTHLNEGVITTSWNDNGSRRLPTAGSQNVAVRDRNELFSMVVRSKSDAMLSELMSIGSRYTAAEAYGAAGEQLDVALSFGSEQTANAGFELYQNTPNPFVGETQIGFNLPDASDVTITINDVSGKTLKVIRGEFAKGYNTVIVNNLPSGVMYYTLESGDFTATLKMINIK